MGKIGRFLHTSRVMPIAIGKVGFWGALKWGFARGQKILHIPVPRSFILQTRYLKYPVKLRARTSDSGIFQECMIEEEYLPLKELSVVTVLDLGANIGLSSAWFLSRYPGASTFAVEADLENYHLCCQNLQPYGSRAKVLHGAAWSKRKDLVVHQHDCCAAANWVGEAGGDGATELSVQGWDIGSLIKMSGFSHIDLLKVDIEGAEEAIFSGDVSDWLPRVRNLCIELHGQASRGAFFGAVENYDFEHVRSGSIDLCMNLRAKVHV